MRRAFETLERSVEAHWKSPRSIVDAMNAGDLPSEFEEMFGYLDPDVEWNTAFAGMNFRGHLGCAQGWDWLVEAAEDYRVTLLGVEDLGPDQVLAEVDRAIKGRGSEIEISAPMFSVVTLEEGLVVTNGRVLQPVGGPRCRGPHLAVKAAVS